MRVGAGGLLMVKHVSSDKEDRPRLTGFIVIGVSFGFEKHTHSDDPFVIQPDAFVLFLLDDVRQEISRHE